MVRNATAVGDTEEPGKKAKENKLLVDRIIGKYKVGLNGPALIVMADIIGGEFSGIFAFYKVLDYLKKENIRLRGEIIGLAGNTGSSKSLFLDLDHQVGIYNETATLYNNGETQGYNEANEFVDLIEEFEEVQKNMPDGTFYLDIKTCPHIKQPYLCVNGDRESLNFAEGFPFPIVRGLEEFVTDHLGFYLNAKDYTGMTLKTGLLDAFSTVEIQEASIWLALVNCGCVDKKDIPDNNPCLNYLYDPQGKLKKVSYEVKYKYTIQEDEFFRMVPGYTNFTRIKIGEVLAYSDGAKILSDWDGLIFMPLYHSQGQDGFFIVQEK